MRHALLGVCFLVLADADVAGASVASVTESGVTLSEGPQARADHVDVEVGPLTVRFSDPAGVVAGEGCEERDVSSVACPLDVDDQVVVRTGQREDRISVADPLLAPRVDLRIDSGPGDDELDGGAAAEELTGGDGADTLEGGGGGDRLIPGYGDDAVDGGDGVDEFVFIQVGYRKRVDLSEGYAQIDPLIGEDERDALAGVEDIDLWHSDAVAIGDDGPNRIRGSARRDVIFGRGGDDVLIGGGSVSKDYRADIPGYDAVFPGQGDDRVLVDAPESSRLKELEVSYADVGGPVVADLGLGVVTGAGLDRIPTEGATGFEGSPADDTVVGHDGAQRIAGGGGSDLLDGGAGPDVIAPDSRLDMDPTDLDHFGEFVGRDDDVILGAEGADTLSYGGYEEFKDYGYHGHPESVLRIDLTLGLATNVGSDGFVGIENAEGPGDLIGDAGPNELHGYTAEGLAGDDVIRPYGDYSSSSGFEGGLGDDDIWSYAGSWVPVRGGPGNDRLRSEGDADAPIEGGPGDDLIEDGAVSYANAPGPVVIERIPSTSPRVPATRGTATGVDGVDTLVRTGELIGSPFDDEIESVDLGHRSEIDAGDGDDVVAGGPQVDWITGGAGEDRVDGGGLVDELYLRDGERDVGSCGPEPGERSIQDDLDVVGPDCDERNGPGPPPIRVLAGPADGETVAPGRIRWLFDTDGARLRCAHGDDDRGRACGNEVVIQRDTPGTYYLSLSAQDSSYEVSNRVIRYTVVRPPPDPPVTPEPIMRPPARTSERMATIVFEGSASSYACELDGESFQPCAANERLEISDLAEGDHHFSIVASNELGSSDPLDIDWTVDRTAPRTRLRLDYPRPSAKRLVARVGSPDADRSFVECSLDGGTWTRNCRWVPRQATAPGPHVIQARATDSVGLRDETPATKRFTVSAAGSQAPLP